MGFELLVAVVVVALDSRIFDRRFHPLDLPIRPGMLYLGEPVLDAILAAPHVEHVRHPNMPGSGGGRIGSVMVIADRTIADDPKHLGARIGITSVLHSWGSAMTHHPHVHMIVPGGGLSEDGSRWIACRANFFLAVRVLSRLFRRLVLQMLIAAHAAGWLQFFGQHAPLADAGEFAPFLSPLRRAEWVVYSNKPFGRPEA